ncbi:hypothetical protein [Larkinella rosea]|uniref:DUF4393 domain-containing protein n=1 Tax=Larkinella rosea TaxID=2025312 RepID=A0A3P1C291_9BACT|nr:hypothetical protein [Larkinella rosea]RRB07402.1 hypothetical protein EHT25_06380 [Larkinella rosea]
MSDINKTSKADILYATVKAGLGSIPVLGSAATELFGLVVTPPLDKRRQEWMNEVAEKIKLLEQNNLVDFSSLSQNEQFIDTIVQASSIAIKTSEQEKIVALRNAVINTALNEAPDKTKSQIFLNLVDSFTVWHLTILTFFDKPKTWFEKAGQTPPNLMIGNMFSVLKTAFPNLEGQDELVDLIWNDLHDAGLHSTGGLKTMMSGDGTLAERTTRLGKEFIQFISES